MVVANSNFPVDNRPFPAPLRANLTLPRRQWGPAEYMVALGKDVEHYAVLKKFVAEGKETLESARQKAVDLGLDPDGVGKITFADEGGLQ